MDRRRRRGSCFCPHRNYIFFAMEGSLSFGVLGPLEVRRGEAIIDFPRRKERQLVAALLIDANQPVSTDQLVERLWGNDAPAKPLASLRACVSNVRKALIDDDGVQPLQTDRGGYRLEVDSAAIDSAQFEQLMTGARQSVADGDDATAAVAVDRALELVRGDTLADLAYDEFAMREIGRLDELVISAQELRVQLAVGLGEAAAWLPKIGELLSAYPLREQLQATWMTALYRLDRQAEALRSYREHRERMIDELGIEPSLELQRLEARILAQDDTLLGDVAASPPQPVSSAAGPEPVDSSPAGPSGAEADAGEDRPQGPTRGRRSMIGRDTEMELLANLAATPPGRAFITGESGSGKSTLAANFIDGLAAEGWRTALGICLDDDGVPPLWPWRQVFRDLGLGEVAAISGDHEFNRFDFFDDLVTALTEAANEQPVALFIDDLQWADPDSLKLLVHLSRRMRSEPLVIVGAARSTPAALSGVAATWIELGNLSVSEVAAVIEQLTGEQGHPELAQDLWQRTEGNAYFVTELIEFARRFGDDVRADLEIPSHVRELVDQRIRVLPSDTNEVLELAALELQSFSPAIIAEVLGCDGAEIERRLEPAVASGVVGPDANSFGRMRFDHAITQETVADRGDPAERVRRHAALGQAMERLAGADSELYATQLSRHYGLGAPAGTAEQAVHWAERAAEDAADTWSHRDAIVHLQRALDADAHLPSPNEERRCRILVRLGEYSRIIGDGATTETILLEAFQLAERIGDPELLAEVALALSEGLGRGHWRWFWTPGSTAISALRRALAVLDTGDSVLRASVMAQLAADGYAEVDADERDSLLTDAVAMAIRLGDPGAIVQALHSQRAAQGWSWPAEQVLAHDRDVLRRSRDQGLHAQELRLRGAVLADLLSLGDLNGARREFGEMADQARLRGSLTWRFFTNQWEVLFAQLRGDWDEANGLSNAALDPVNGLGEDFADAVINQMQITLYYQGNYAPIEELLRAGSTMADRPLFSRALLNVLAIDGRIDEAADVLQTIDPLRPDMDQVGGRLVPSLVVEALVAMGEHDQLPALIDFLEPAAGVLVVGTPGLGGMVFFGPLRYHLALGLIALGRLDQARTELDLATAHMGALEAAPQLLRLRFAKALLAAAENDSTAARDLMEEVRAAATGQGMAGLAGRAERLLARPAS